ncbi:Proteasome subunit beta type-6 [Balamuthia mandrillaris]
MEMSTGLQKNQVPEWMSTEHDMGTSIMAVEFDGGVIMGADSRTTTGAYIANRASDKITAVHNRIYCCRSGSAADTQAIADYVNWYLKLHSVELGEDPEVKTAANLFKQLCYHNKNFLMAGIICAGWDKYNGGSVYTIPLGGAMVRQPFSIGGSGSTYIYGFCDAHYRPNMTREECEEFVVKALALAMERDGSSGGLIRLVCITKEGVERKMIPGNALPAFAAENM